jgi:hypothetical protein
MKFMQCFKGGQTYKSLGTSSREIKNVEGYEHTETHTQQDDLISILYFLKVREVGYIQSDSGVVFSQISNICQSLSNEANKSEVMDLVNILKGQM